MQNSLCVFWFSLPSCLKDVFSFACQIKLSCNTENVTLVCPLLQTFAAVRQNQGNYKLP